MVRTTREALEAVAKYERAGHRHTERYHDNPYAQAWFVKERAATDPV